MIVYCLILAQTLGLGSCLQANEKLYNSLMKNYEAAVEPVSKDPYTNKSTPLIVYTLPTIYSLIDVSEADQTITTSRWSYMGWNDNRLAWNPADHDNIEDINLPIANIWVPDIYCYETINIEDVTTLPLYARVFSTGDIYYSVPLVARTHCKMSVKDFPYDRQNCSFTFTSWSYDGRKIVLRSVPSRSAPYQPNNEWDLVSIDAHNISNTYYGDTTFYEVKVFLIIDRNPGYYEMTLTFPCFLIVTISLLGLFSPNDAKLERTERVTLGLTALLTIAVVLMMVADLMPKSSDDFPLLGNFILNELCLITAATMVATVLMYLNCQLAFERWPPQWLYKAVLLSRLLEKQKKVDQSSATTYSTDNTRTRNSKPYSYNNRHSDDTIEEAMLSVLKRLHYDTNDIRHQIESMSTNDGNDQMAKHWTLICFRLDIFFLILFMIIQFTQVTFFVRL